MADTLRTVIFAVAAALSVGAAVVADRLTRPPVLEGFEKVGSGFYPEFVDANAATGLKLVSFREDLAQVSTFEVVHKDGRWRIPSRHDYPADAKDRLARTAASVIGITRDALASRRESDHERYGVLDPLAVDEKHLKGLGQRFVLSGSEPEPLVDLVIGKPVEGRAGFFYVRKPDEKETYVVRLKIDLSVRFADWIEPDLLKLDRDKLTEVVVNRYSIDETEGRLTGNEVNRLTRPKWSDPWKLQGLDEEQETLAEDEIRKLVDNLDDLKIVGVRPKQKGIKADLSIDQKVVRSQIQLAMLRRELQDAGFYIAFDRDEKPVLVSKQGEVEGGTEDGVRYVLHFGEEFEGTEEDVEAGFTKQAQGEDDKAAGEKKAEDAKKDGEKKDEAKKGPLRRSRYLFVTAHFDPQLVPGRPVEPVKPEPPTDKPAADKPTTDKPADKPSDKPADKPVDKPADKPTDKPAEKPSEKPDPKPADKPKDGAGDEDEEEQEPPAKTAPPAKDEKPPVKSAPTGTDPAPPTASSPEEAKKKYDADLKRYEADLARYKDDVTAYERKLADGQKKVDELNDRFGGWFYVISAESFDTLRLSRQQLVKPKEKPASTDPAPSTPDSTPKPDALKPDAPKPDAPKPDAPKPDAPKPDAPKPDAPKPDAPKPDAPKPDAPKPDAPKPDAPKPDAPKPDAPKPDAPKPE